MNDHFILFLYFSTYKQEEIEYHIAYGCDDKCVILEYNNLEFELRISTLMH